jgi:hypothetical protein
MVAQVGYSVVGRSRGRVTLCAVYIVHVEMRSASFLAEPQNQAQRFISGLASKPLGRFVCFLRFGLKTSCDGFSHFGLKTYGDGFPDLASKARVTVSRFEPQNRQLRFGDFGLKITAAVF